MGKNLLAKADSLFSIGEMETATDEYQKILNNLQKQKAWQAYLETGKRCYDSLQNHQATELAFRILQQSLRVIEPHANEIEPLFLASLYHQMGIEHYYLFQEKEALAYYQKALQIRQQYMESPHLDIAKGFFNIGVCYKELEDFSNALNFQEQALKSYRQLKIPQRLARTYRELGLINSKLGDLEQSKRYYSAALDLYQIHFKNEPWNVADLHIDLTALFEKQDSAHLVIFHAQKALDLLHAIEGKEEADFFAIANCYQNLGTAYDILQQLPKAVEQYQNAQNINQQYPQKRTERIADNWINMGVALIKIGKFERAERALQQALSINQTLNKPINLAINLHNFGELYRHQKNWQKALEFYEKGFQYLVLDYTSTDWQQNPSPQKQIIIDKVRLLRQLQRKAKALNDWGKASQNPIYWQAAVQVVDTAALLMDMLRLEYNFDGSKRFLTNLIRPTLEVGVDAALSLHQKSQRQEDLAHAFAFVEKAKAAVLLDAVIESKAKVAANFSPKQLQREQQLKKAISALEHQLFERKEAPIDTLANWRNQILILTEQLGQLRDSFELLDPKFTSIRHPEQLPIAEIKTRILRDGEALINYFLTENKLIVFYLSKTEALDAISLVLDFPLQHYIKNLQKGIAEKFTSNKSYSELEQQQLDKLYAQYAHLLYQKLLQAVVEKHQLPEKLRIIPDGILGFVPFDALLSTAVKEQNFASYDFLAKKYNISYCYSTALLKSMQESMNKAAYQQILAFAPNFPIQGLSDQSITNNRAKLSPLFFNAEEVEAILDMLPGQSFLAENATREQFEEWAHQYALLHLSTHARVNDQHPQYSYIAFTQTKDSLDVEQLMFLDFLYHLSLKADMVVLSACETGIGEVDRGEGLISLARAFSYAGAKSLVTSLWKVNDQRTKELMVHFYEGLAQRHQKDMALWQAKKNFIQHGGQIAHPYYWAGFVPIGNMESVDLKQNWSIWYLLGGVFILVGVLLSLGWRNRQSAIVK